jgi:hypothetical protein
VNSTFIIQGLKEGDMWKKVNYKQKEDKKNKEEGKPNKKEIEKKKWNKIMMTTSKKIIIKNKSTNTGLPQA